jgi:hypothetical protein
MGNQQSITSQQTKTASPAGEHNKSILPAITSLEARDALDLLNRFIGTQQRAGINILCQSEERQFYYQSLMRLKNIIETMPVTFQIKRNEVVTAHLHYFTATTHFFITKRDRDAWQLQAYGLTILSDGDKKLGYLGIDEILRGGAVLDLSWSPVELNQVYELMESK